MTNEQGAAALDQRLWLAFWVLFGMMVVTVWLPVDPVVLGVPFWTLIALALMVGASVVAAVAGLHHGWPARSTTDGEPR